VPVAVERDGDRGVAHVGREGLGVDAGGDHERRVGMANRANPVNGFQDRRTRDHSEASIGHDRAQTASCVARHR